MLLHMTFVIFQIPNCIRWFAKVSTEGLHTPSPKWHMSYLWCPAVNDDTTASAIMPLGEAALTQDPAEILIAVCGAAVQAVRLRQMTYNQARQIDDHPMVSACLSFANHGVYFRLTISTNHQQHFCTKRIAARSPKILIVDKFGL